jgi:hypothetical protein
MSGWRTGLTTAPGKLRWSVSRAWLRLAVGSIEVDNSQGDLIVADRGASLQDLE